MDRLKGKRLAETIPVGVEVERSGKNVIIQDIISKNKESDFS